jgi:hypothetical protein
MQTPLWGAREEYFDDDDVTVYSSRLFPACTAPTCVLRVIPKPMNLSSNSGVSPLATYKGSYYLMLIISFDRYEMKL